MNGDVTQSAEYLLHMQNVVGSIPTITSIKGIL